MSFSALRKSFAIYFTSETVISQYKQSSPEEAGKRIILGVVIDAIIMRRFHRFVDNNKLINIHKVALEQVAIAPTIGTMFLMIHDNFSITNLKNMVYDDGRFWIPVSFIGYKFVSTEKRYIYTGFASVVWNNIRVLNYT